MQPHHDKTARNSFIATPSTPIITGHGGSGLAGGGICETTAEGVAMTLVCYYVLFVS